MRVKMPCPHGRIRCFKRNIRERRLRRAQRCGEAAYKSFTALEFQFSSGTVFAKVFLDDVSINPAGVPDGGSTVSLLGCALLGVTVLRRKLRC